MKFFQKFFKKKHHARIPQVINEDEIEINEDDDDDSGSAYVTFTVFEDNDDEFFITVDSSDLSEEMASKFANMLFTFITGQSESALFEVMTDFSKKSKEHHNFMHTVAYQLSDMLKQEMLEAQELENDFIDPMLVLSLGINKDA